MFGGVRFVGFNRVLQGEQPGLEFQIDRHHT
jgi:hypothetical protein